MDKALNKNIALYLLSTNNFSRGIEDTQKI